jgi:hypothetical protein
MASIVRTLHQHPSSPDPPRCGFVQNGSLTLPNLPEKRKQTQYGTAELGLGRGFGSEGKAGVATHRLD